MATDQTGTTEPGPDEPINEPDQPVEVCQTCEGSGEVFVRRNSRGQIDYIDGSPTSETTASRRLVDVVEEKMNDLREVIRAVVAASSLPDAPGEVMTLDELVLAERRRLRLTLQDVADASGMTKSHIWAVEAGRSRNPTVKCLYGLSIALGIPFMVVCRSALKSLEIADVSDAA